MANPFREPEQQHFNYSVVPEGTYRCFVSEVRSGTTRAGDERWSLKLHVAEGPFTGQLAAWDSLVFSHRGNARARQVFRAFGLKPIRSDRDYLPSDLKGREALVTVRKTEYLSEATGMTVIRNEVPYDGYQPIPQEYP